MARYERFLTLRIDDNLHNLIKEAWRRMPFYSNRSDVIRDLIRIGCAVVMGMNVELSYGTRIEVNNPQVIIKVPRRALPKAMSIKVKHVNNALKKLRALLAKVNRTRNVVAIANDRVVVQYGNMELHLDTRSLRRLMNDIYVGISEAITLLENALHGVDLEDVEQHHPEEAETGSGAPEHMQTPAGMEGGAPRDGEGV